MKLIYKDILINKLEDFEIEENPDKKKLLRTEIFNILNEIENLDSEDYHIWGLTFYFSDDDRKYHLNLALEKFIKAFELDSTNFLACLYIAHCYHDKLELDDAVKFYLSVDQEKLQEFQISRYVKLIEQIGFCHYKLGRKGEGRKKFEEVLNWYRKLPMEDRAVPSEMLDCLPDSDEIIKEIKEIEDYLE